MSDEAASGADTQRVDKWLWFARVVKTRSLATALVSRGKVRVNRQKIRKPSHPVIPGDVLTIALYGGVRVLKVLDFGERRGPAPEARLLYDDLSAPNTDGTDGADGPAPDEPGN